MEYAVLVLWILLVILFGLFLHKALVHRKLQNRFKEVINIDNEKTKVTKELEELNSQLEHLQLSYAKKEERLGKDYQSKRQIYERLLRELSIVEDDLEFASFGVYKPHFDFDTSEDFKATIKATREKQKQLIRDKAATFCPQKWTVEGSRREGKKMQNRYRKLILRAFNGECDAAIAKVRWNNVDKMVARVRKAARDVNKMSEVVAMSITTKYINLRVAEVLLTHEYHEKKHQEKEEQKRIRQQIREEEKAAREYEKAKRKAEKEEQRYQQALQKARADVTKSEGAKLSKLQSQIVDLEAKLQEAQKNKQRATSMAELTKSGHVYVISNIGSFGDNVYKIGMTRRLEPHDRVRELGDASVPFKYDVHAMIYSDNAPKLENELHHHFDDRRLNLVNLRREFFDVSLDEIEDAVTKKHGRIEFTKLAEAREYRESQAIRTQVKAKRATSDDVGERIAHQFPEAL